MKIKDRWKRYVTVRDKVNELGEVLVEFQDGESDACRAIDSLLYSEGQIILTELLPKNFYTKNSHRWIVYSGSRNNVGDLLFQLVWYETDFKTLKKELNRLVEILESSKDV